MKQEITEKQVLFWWHLLNHKTWTLVFRVLKKKGSRTQSPMTQQGAWTFQRKRPKTNTLSVWQKLKFIFSSSSTKKASVIVPKLWEEVENKMCNWELQPKSPFYMNLQVKFMSPKCLRISILNKIYQSGNDPGAWYKHG